MISHELVSQQASSNSLQVLSSKEQIAKNIDDGITEYGTQRYRIYLEDKSIGKVFARGTHHYASPISMYLGVGKAFDRLDRARDYLVDAYHSLLESPISVEQRDGITYVNLGDRAVGECYYSRTYQQWIGCAYPEVIPSHNERFKNDTDAIAWIINKSLERKPQLTTAQIKLRLENQYEYAIATIQADPHNLCLANILAYYNKHNCTEFTAIAIVAID